MRVLVVGGGIVGLCCAWALVEEGAEVAVVDRDRFGSAASSGNAGWVTPGLSAPIPAPGVMRQALRWMLDPESPLLVRPRLQPSFLAWSWRFARSCRVQPHQAGTAATLALAADAEERYDELAAAGVTFEMHRDGLLYLVREAEKLETWLAMYRELAGLGFEAPLEVLHGDELHAFEPAAADGVAAGLLDRRERHLRPETLIAGLVEHLRARGAELCERTPVARLVRSRHGWRAETASGAVDADRAVIAAGVWTKELLAPLGVRMPLEAAKGYSVTLPRATSLPARPLYLTEIKVGASPFQTDLRLAGTLELAGIDLTVNRRRVDAIVSGARDYLRDLDATAARVEWAGLRPVAPDGLPVIGRVPGQEGLFVATGHAMNGITLAPSTGAAIAPLVLHDERPRVLEPLGPERFARRRRPRAAGFGPRRARCSG